MTSGGRYLEKAIMSVLSHIPATVETHGTDPARRARGIANAAALKAASVSGTLSLPPGPAGWLTIIPDLTMVWKIQSQMVADIAGAFGRTSALSQEQMLYCLFRHAAAQAVRDLVVRAGERVLIKRVPARGLQAVIRKIGIPLTRRLAGRGVSRWLPIIGAVGVAGYAYYDTRRVAVTAIDLFRSGSIEQTPAIESPPTE